VRQRSWRDSSSHPSKRGPVPRVLQDCHPFIGPPSEEVGRSGPAVDERRHGSSCWARLAQRQLHQRVAWQRGTSHVRCERAHSWGSVSMARRNSRSCPPSPSPAARTWPGSCALPRACRPTRQPFHPSAGLETGVAVAFAATAGAGYEARKARLGGSVTRILSQSPLSSIPSPHPTCRCRCLRQLGCMELRMVSPRHRRALLPSLTFAV